MEMDDSETTPGRSPRKSPTTPSSIKKETMEVDQEDKASSKAISPSKTVKQESETDEKDEHTEDDESPEEKRPPSAAKKVKDDEFLSDDDREVMAAAAKESDPREIMKAVAARKEFAKKWIEQKPDEDLERPFPAMGDKKNFCWYDLREDWRADRLPLAIPVDRVNRRFNYGEEGFAMLPFAEPQGSCKIGRSTRPRDRLIAEAMNSFANGVRSLEHLESGILSYWKGFRAINLKKLFAGATRETRNAYLSIMTKIAKLTQSAKHLITKPLPTITRNGDVKSVSMSQEQAACLLAYAFFCAVMPDEEGEFNHFTFHNIHDKSSPVYIEKMKFILYYFKAVTDEMPCGTLTFSRQEWTFVRDERSGYDKWEDPLSEMLVLSEGLIEEMEGCLQVDFANEYIGGGVCGHGAVQEEIRFLCCPEMIVSLFLCDRMRPNEAILIQGAQQFSTFSGYGNTLKHVPMQLRRDEPRDKFGRARSYLVAIDAIRFEKKYTQYESDKITREIKKAYAGFMRTDEEPARPVATGNWGCGVFNGDKELKSLIQLIAASKAGRPMIYVSFQDAKFAKELEEVMDVIRSYEISNGTLFSLLRAYKDNRSTGQTVFSFVKTALASGAAI